jgi:hypothetical protein
MGGKIICTDVDGVLLDMNTAYWEGVSKALGKQVWGPNPHWDYRQTAGVGKQAEALIWNHIWSTPLEVYNSAGDTLKYCQSQRVRMLACSVRPEGPAKEAAKRDFPKLGIPWTTFETHQDKAEFILRTSRSFERCLYLEDKWDSADDMAREGVDTYLIHAGYNVSKDLDVYYTRIYPHEMLQAVKMWLRGEKYEG